MKPLPFVITVVALATAGACLLALAVTSVFFIGTSEQVTPAFALQTIAGRFLVMLVTALISSGIFRLGAHFFPQDKVLAFLASRKVLLGSLVFSLMLLIAIWGPEIFVTT